MGSFANALFKVMLSWLQGAVSLLWSSFTNPGGNPFLNLIGQFWIPAAGILCLCGLGADLWVYVYRRKSLKKIQKDSYPAAPEAEPIQPPREEAVQADSFVPASDSGDPDLSMWEEPEEADEDVQDASFQEQPVTVTKAGYTIPADSPYRRPQETAPGADDPEAGTETTETGNEEKPAPAGMRRRRRINLGDLFNDPEEELQVFEAPQHLIDSKKAYHEPIYPQGWKKGAEQSHE